jgi:hypothetical protein
MKSDITNLLHEVNNVGKDVAQLLDSQKAMSNLTVAQQKNLNVDWISSLSFKIDHEQLLEAWVPDTAAWIFFHDLYRDWHQSPHSRFLCVQGNAGCGKSMLASRVIESITKEIAQYRGQSLAYVYCKARSLPSYTTQSPPFTCTFHLPTLPHALTCHHLKLSLSHTPHLHLLWVKHQPFPLLLPSPKLASHHRQPPPKLASILPLALLLLKLNTPHLHPLLRRTSLLPLAITINTRHHQPVREIPRALHRVPNSISGAPRRQRGPCGRREEPVDSADGDVREGGERGSEEAEGWEVPECGEEGEGCCEDPLG